MNIIEIKDGVAVINTPVVAVIPEFNAILRRRMVASGDSDGREKVMNLRVFAYILYAAEWRATNPIAALPDQLRLPKAIELAGLPNGWRPDKEVQVAIDRYIEIMTFLAPSAKALIAAKRGLNQAGDQIMIAVEQNQFIIDKITEATRSAFTGDIADPDYAKKIEVLQSLNNFFSANIKELRATIKDLGNLHSTVEDFERTVSQQVSENHDLYGGGVLNQRELPPDQRKSKFVS